MASLDLLRGPYKPHQYGKVILPLTVLRRLDCVLEDTKPKVLEKYAALKSGKVKDIAPILNRVSKYSFHNTSKLDFQKLKGDPDKITQNLTHYIKSFSSNARQIFDFFEFEKELAHMDEANITYLVVSKFAELNLHPSIVPNHEMGSIFEDLIRRFNEVSNETAGDHFTPREVIRLMVNLLFEPDTAALRKKGIVKTLYDPACGTGGMLSVAEEYLRELNPDAKLEAFGQDYNNEAFAICCSDMMIKGQDPEHIKFGNSFTQDGLPDQKFEYMLANPPFGVKWEKEKVSIDQEAQRGQLGRFGAGTPRINDGTFLFLQHMLSKRRPEGSRLAIVFNGSPLFTGNAGPGESEIRRWIIENDWLEAIVALPDQMFYNTGIYTYIWILTSRKRKGRRGKIQLINGTELFQKMPKSLGNKRNVMSPEHISDVTRIYGEYTDGIFSKIFDNADFGYQQITVERPLRLRFLITDDKIDAVRTEGAFQRLATSKKKGKAGLAEIEIGRTLRQQIVAMLQSMVGVDDYMSRPKFEAWLSKTASAGSTKLSAPITKAILNAVGERNAAAEICMNGDGDPEPDPQLRDYEDVPLKEDIHEYFKREVLPHVSDAWIDESRTKIGYEIPFGRYFTKYIPPRPIEEIRADIKKIEQEVLKALAEVAG